MPETKQISIIKIIGVTAGIIAGLQTIIGVSVKPMLDRYIDDSVEAHIEELKTEQNDKPSFRALLAPKMKIDEDEVHIKIGTDHRTEDAFRAFTINSIDSLKEEVTKVKASTAFINKEIIYYHPGTLIMSPIN